MARSKQQIQRVTQAAYDTPWAITRAKLDVIADVLDRRALGQFSSEEIEARLHGLRRPAADDEPIDAYRMQDGVAIVPLYGVLGPRMNLMMDISGGTSTQEFAAAVQEAVDDPDVKAIVLDVDSPGGNVLGTQEAADVVAAAREKKPLVAVVTGQMCSAAYCIGSAAREIVASPSSQVGSIGVYMMHADYVVADAQEGVRRTVIHAAPYKTIGNDAETINQTARDRLRAEVDDYYAAFVAAVAKHRGVSAATVREKFGGGDSFIASRALAMGLIDRVGTLSQVVNELATQGGQTSAPPAPAFHPVFSLKESQQMAKDTNGTPVADAKSEVTQATTAAADSSRTDIAQAARDLAQTSAAARLEAQRARSEERERITAIQTQGRILSATTEQIQAAVEAGQSLADFLVATTKRLAAEREPVARVEAGPSSKEKFSAAAVDALAVRCGVSVAKPAPGAADFRYARLLDLAAESLRVSSGRRPVADADTLARAALGDLEARAILGADVPYSTPGDFPNILSNLANKLLEAMPPYAQSTFQNWAYRKPSVPDFKPATLVAIGEFGEMPYHGDGRDFEQSKPSEEMNWIAVDSYGDEFALTPRMIVDDNLGAFSEALTDKQAAHDATLNRLCCNLLTSNPTLVDTGALFNTTAQTSAGGHANLLGSTGAPSKTTLTAICLLIRNMLGASLKRRLNYTIAGLLIPPDLETTVQELLQVTLGQVSLGINPPTVAAVTNVSSGADIFRGSMEWWVEPMLGDHSASAWYAFVAPAIARAIVYCYQQGFERMATRNYYNPKNNCRIWQFEGRFAAAVQNYRGVAKGNT